MRLHGKIGIVTAAGAGMGAAGAMRFAAEGAMVAVVDRDGDHANKVADAILARGQKAIAIVGDLRDDSFAKDIVSCTADAFGGLDFVWNHVGHPGPGSFEGMEMDQYDLAMDLNLRSVVVTSEAAIAPLRQRGGGALLFTSSTSGMVGSPASPIYSAGKFAVIGLARALAKRLAVDNIRCNVVCPGAVDTQMLRSFMSRADQPAGTADTENLIRQRASQIPLGRLGQPQDIANAALFLVSEEASFISGAVLPVDGGSTA